MYKSNDGWISGEWVDEPGDETRAQSRRRAEGDLDRWRGEALFAHASEAIVDIDPTGAIMAFNPAAERLFGHLAEDVVGSPVGVLAPDHSPEEVATMLSDLAGQGEVEAGATELRRRDGEVLDLSVTVLPLSRADGSAAGFTVIARDLTALRRSHSALAASEERYRTIVETAYEGIALLDTRQRLTFVNNRCAEMLGYEVDEMIGMPLDVLVFPEDARDVEEMMERRRMGSPEETEARWRRKDGTVLWTLNASAPIFDEAGTFTGSCAFVSDLTERKRFEAALRESEARLRSFFEYAPVGILLVSRDGLVENMNPVLCSITGYDTDELSGNGLPILLGPDHPARIEELTERIRALLTGEMPSFEFEQPFVTKDGRSIWMDVNVSLMRDDHGDPFEIVVVVQDVTYRKDAERVKDEFLSVTSHELRTPLTSIRGALGLLTGGVVGDLPGSAQRMLDIAVQSTDRLIRLINDILDLERLTTGKLALSLEACEASGLVARAVEEIQGAADAHEVEVRVASVSGRVWASPDRVIQTLTNLIGNAIKFSSRAGVVEVSAKEERDHVLFAVVDRGPGIPADQLESVFERFQQVDATDARAKGGTGLGLAICRTIVEQHGGRIWAESVLGEGATFRFSLPAVADIDEEGSDEHLTEPKVLVCDDDEATREVVKTVLQANGYQVWTAANGEEALAVARIRQLDLIMLDLFLPGIDGRETAIALKSQEETANIPIVVLSVVSAAQVGVEVEGAVAWIEKPIEEGVLMDALRRALGSGRQQALVVEDDPQLAEMLEMTLARHGLVVRHARTGREAMRLGRAFVPDLLVLDLTLPNGDGYSVVEWMHEQQWLSAVPLMVYAAIDLGEADRSRMRLGETKFMVKSRTSPAMFEAELEDLLGSIARDGSRR